MSDLLSPEFVQDLATRRTEKKLNEIFVYSDHPEEEKARVEAAKIFQEFHNVDYTNAYTNADQYRDDLFQRVMAVEPDDDSVISRQKDALIKGLNTGTHSGFLEGMKTAARGILDEWKAGIQDNELGNLGAMIMWQESRGVNTDYLWEDVKKIQASQLELSQFDVNDTDVLKDIVLNPKNWIKGAARMAPWMLATTGEAAMYAMGTGLLGAAIGGSSSGAGAGPGFMIGFGSGMTAGQYLVSARKEAGIAYIQYRDEGAPHQTAMVSSFIYGSIAAAVETVQMKQVLGTVPGLKSLMRGVAQETTEKLVYPTMGRAVRGVVGQSLKKGGIEAIKQSGEEAAQEFAFIFIDEAWKAAENRYGANFPRRDFEDYVNEVGTVFASTLGSMFVMSIGGVSAGQVRKSTTQARMEKKATEEWIASNEVRGEIEDMLSLPTREVKEGAEGEWIAIQNALAVAMAEDRQLIHGKIAFPRIIYEPDEMLYELENKIQMQEGLLDGRKKVRGMNPVNIAMLEENVNVLRELRDRVIAITEVTHKGVFDIPETIAVDYSDKIEFQQEVEKQELIKRALPSYEDDPQYPWIWRDKLVNDPDQPFERHIGQTFEQQEGALQFLNDFVFEYGDKLDPAVLTIMDEALQGMNSNVEVEADVYFTELQAEVEDMRGELRAEMDEVSRLSAEGEDWRTAFKQLQGRMQTFNKKTLAADLGYQMWNRAKGFVVSSQLRKKYEAETLEKANKFKARLFSKEYKEARGANRFISRVMESDTPNIDYYDQQMRKAYRKVKQEEIDLTYPVAQGIAEYQGVSLEKLLEGFQGAFRPDPPYESDIALAAIYTSLWGDKFYFVGSKGSRFLSILHEWAHYLANHLNKDHFKQMQYLLGDNFHNEEPVARMFEWWILMGQIEADRLSFLKQYQEALREKTPEDEMDWIQEKMGEYNTDEIIEAVWDIFEEVFAKDDVDIGDFALGDILPEDEMDLFLKMQDEDLIPDVEYTDEQREVQKARAKLEQWQQTENEAQNAVEEITTNQRILAKTDETLKDEIYLRQQKLLNARQMVYKYQTYIDILGSGLAFEAGKVQGKAIVYDHGHVSRIMQGLRNRLKAHVIRLSRQINYKIADNTEMYHKLLIEQIQAKFNPTMRKNLDVIKNIEDDMVDMNFFEKLGIYDTLKKEIGKVTLDEMETLAGVVDMLRLSGRMAYDQKNMEIQQGAELVAQTMVRSLLEEDPLIRQAQGEARAVAATPQAAKALYYNVQSFIGRPADIFDSLDGAQGTYDGLIHDVFYSVALEQKAYAERIEKTRIQEFRDELKRLNIQDEEFFEEITAGGKTYTVQQWMTIYLASQVDETRQRLIDGNKVPLVLFKNINDIVPKKYREAAEAIARNYREAWPRGRMAAVDMFGRDIGYVDMYFPLLTQAKPVEQVDFDEYFRSLRVEHAGYADSFRYKRTGSGAVDLNLVTNFYDQVPKFERFVGTTQSVRMMKAVMGDEEVTAAIRQKRGQAFIKAVNDYIDVYVNPSVYRTFGVGEQLARKAKKHAALAQLGLNISVILKQGPSFLMYLEAAGPTYFGAAVQEFIKNPEALITKVKELDPYMEFQVHERLMLEFKTIGPSKFKNNYSKAQRALMAPIAWVDQTVKTIGWYSVYLQKKEGEFLSEQEAIRKARNVTTREQPSGDPTTLPKMYRTHEFANVALMYTNQITKLFDMVYYQVPALMRSGNAKEGWLKLGAIYGVTSMIWGITHLRAPSSLEDVMEILAGPVGWIPFVGKMITAELNGFYDSGNPVFSSVRSLVRAGKAVSRGDYDRAFMDYAQSLTFMLGLPFAPVKKTKRAIETGDYWNLIGSPDRKKKKSFTMQRRGELF